MSADLSSEALGEGGSLGEGGGHPFLKNDIGLEVRSLLQPGTNKGPILGALLFPTNNGFIDQRGAEGECASQPVTEAREKLGGEALAPPGAARLSSPKSSPMPDKGLCSSRITRASQATPLQLIPNRNKTTAKRCCETVLGPGAPSGPDQGFQKGQKPKGGGNTTRPL